MQTYNFYVFISQVLIKISRAKLAGSVAVIFYREKTRALQCSSEVKFINYNVLLIFYLKAQCLYI